MYDVLTYDVSDSNGSFDGVQFTGKAEGTFFKFTPNDAEPVKMKEGADKEAAFIVNKLGGGKGEVTCMHTSDSNRLLLAKFYAKKKGVFQFEDSLGNRVMSRQAMIQGVPDFNAAGGDGPDDRPWMFLLTNVVITAPLVSTPL